MGSPRFCQTILKIKQKISLKFFQITPKTREGIPKIPFTISKTTQKDPRDSFKSLQKQNKTGFRDSFKLLQKPSKGFLIFFQTTSKKKVVAEIIKKC